MNRFLGGASALVAVLALGEPARAQGGSNVALAESLYQEGKRLVAEGRFDLACPKFAESYKLDPATGTLLNLAACYESAGKFGTAWANYNEALVAAKREGQDFRVKYATEHLAALEEKLTRFVIQLPPEANVPGLEVKLDGQVVPPGAFGVPAPIDPGVHAVDAAAPGKKPAHLELMANAPKELVTATIPLLENAPPVAMPPITHVSPNPKEQRPVARSEPVEPATHGGTLRTVGYIVGAAGVLGAGAGGAFYVIANRQNNTAKGQCTEGPDENLCESSAERISHKLNVDAAQTNYTLSLVGFGVGGALIATGLVFVLVGGPKRDQHAFFFTPRVDARGGGIELGAHF